MRIALVQERQNCLYAFHSSDPLGSRDEVLFHVEEMVEQNLSLLEKAANAGADLALTSEAINYPGPQRLLGDLSSADLVACGQNDLVRRVSRLCRDAGMNAVVGMLCCDSGGRLFNAAVAFDRKGREAHRYCKNFLAGEEKEYMEAGSGFPLWESEFGRIGIGICWDLQFPVVAQSFALQGADLVLCPTWGWESTYATSRAYESGVYVAAAMAVPSYKPVVEPRMPSSVISPEGEALVVGPRDSEGVVMADIEDIHGFSCLRETRMGDLRAWMDRRGIGHERCVASENKE